MNEALKPDDVTQRSVPATVETARPRRRRAFWSGSRSSPRWPRQPSSRGRNSSAASPRTRDAKIGPPGQPPQTVRVAPVTLGDMPITIDALGTVTPFETVTVRTQIAGKLQEVGFTEGQIVKKGDFLAQIDPRPYEAALAQAQGQLAKDRRCSPRRRAISPVTKRSPSRIRSPSSRSPIRRRWSRRTRPRSPTDQAQVRRAKLNIAYTHIVSPITGRVGLRLVDPGNYLQPSDSTGIVVITQIDPISVVFSTPEDNLPRIAARLNSGADLRSPCFDRANVDHAGDRDADHLRQPDRRHDRHDQDAGDIRQPEGRSVPQPVRQRPFAGRHA